MSLLTRTAHHKITYDHRRNGYALNMSRARLEKLAARYNVPPPVLAPGQQRMKRHERRVWASAVLDAAARGALAALYRYDTPSKQAAHVIAKFGGPAALSRALTSLPIRSGDQNDEVFVRTRSLIYRWLYPRQRGGTGGMIPLSVWPGIKKAARYEGILLTMEDFAP